ncbi:mycothiol transferase [Aquimarina sediminis]|uniref:mycothiol transferase n=1 Tax=Aquimarina sediminis TaxID=2070536 RepID=UPI001F4D52A8|nr:DUF664 domain-containing protein [Aquimarina sediminis]
MSINTNAQRANWTQQEWSSFVQTIVVKTDKKIKFKLQADVKVLGASEKNKAGLWVRVDNAPGEYGFFDNMNDRPITSSEWKTYAIEGYIDENAKAINFGGICYYNAAFYFDNFALFTETENGEFERLEIKNSGFEKTITDEGDIPNWQRGISKNRKMRVEGFTYQSSKDTKDGKYALLITGNNVKKDSSRFINSSKEYTPQIGTLVSMLNNLSTRVERTVKNLNQRELDHLLDDKANRIGALLLHLAAAEAYYQVYTFENRGFNEEEKKKWSLALELGDEARKIIRGHDVEYYLDIYKKVRKKTLEELLKRNDEWLKEGGRQGSNYHYNWFHVMEHQSSHLGQILLLKKRIPEDEKITVPKEKVDQ